MNSTNPDLTSYRSLREFVDGLSQLGWLHEVDMAVDKDWEIACIARWAMESTGESDAYAIRFNQVLGHDIPVVVGLYGSQRLVARSLGTPSAGIWDSWRIALREPIEPELVPTGPIKDHIVSGDMVDLTKLPIPIWTPGRDLSPYISSACVVTVDHDGKRPNLGTYRVEVQGPRQLGLFFGSPKQHGAMHLRTWEENGEPMPKHPIRIGAAELTPL